MKTWKQTFIGIAAILAITLAFTACDDGNGGTATWGNPPAALVGTWLMMGTSPVMVINANGTGTVGGDPVNSWEVKGNELKMDYSGVESIVKWSISGSQLTITYPDDTSTLGLGNMLIAFSPLTKQSGSSNSGDDTKPEKLASNATASQANAKLDEIISYSGTPAETKSMAQTLKNSMSDYMLTWSTSGSSVIAAINGLIDEIPDSVNPPIGTDSPVSITVTPTSLQVPFGTSLEALKEKLTVTVIWSSGRNETVTDYTLTGSNLYAPGSYTVTVQFGNQSKNITVTVVDGAVEMLCLEYDGNYSGWYDSNLPQSSYHNYGSMVTVSSLIPVRYGYTFAGWNTDPYGYGTAYAAGAKFAITGNTTLYAQWQEDNEGGTDTPTLTGSVSINGTAQVGQTLTANTSSLGGSGTITYKWWWKNAISLFFDLDGDGIDDLVELDGEHVDKFLGNNSSYIVQSADVGGFILLTVTRSGNYGSVKSEWVAVTGVTGGTNYTVTFNANGGNGSVSSISAASGSTITLPSGSDLYRDGYTFSGWISGTTNYNAGSSYTVTGDVTLYARWTAIPAVRPDTPTGVTATAQSSSSILITWFPVSGATSYKIINRPLQGGESLRGTTTSTSYTVTGLSPSTTYYFQVSAVNSAGESTFRSEVVYARTLAR